MNFPLPSLEGRKEIFAVGLRGKPLAVTLTAGRAGPAHRGV